MSEVGRWTQLATRTKAVGVATSVTNCAVRRSSLMIDELIAVAIAEKPLEIGKPVSITEVIPKDIDWITKNSCAL